MTGLAGAHTSTYQFILLAHFFIGCSNISFFLLFQLDSSHLSDNFFIIIITRWSGYSSPYLNNKMSLQGPKPWLSILQFLNKTWTDIDRRNIIMDKIEH